MAPRICRENSRPALRLCGDNCIDIYANDLGLLAICDDFKIIGYNVLVGGGMGVVPSAAKTFPAVAKRMAFVQPDQVIDVATAVVKVQRDFGNRSDRKVARLKYTIHNMGLAQFKAKVEEYYGQPLPEPHPDDVTGFDDHLGWHEQGDGRWFYGLNIENGRIHDIGRWQLKTALREICRKYRPGIRLTAHQSLLFTDIAPDAIGPESKRFCTGTRSSYRTKSPTSGAGRWPASPGPPAGWRSPRPSGPCRSMLDQLGSRVGEDRTGGRRVHAPHDRLPQRLRPALQLRHRPGWAGRWISYTIFVGGRLLGDRLNFIYKDMVASSDVVPTLMPLFVYFKQSRHAGETFGDFCLRKGPTDLLEWTTTFSLQKLNTWSAVGGGDLAQPSGAVLRA